MASSDPTPPDGETMPDGETPTTPAKKTARKPPKPKGAMPPAIGSTDVPLLELDAGYDILIMDRRQLEDWPFNPRVMSLESAAKLKAALTGGLLGPACVWNKRNGKLVGGHQRLRQLDGLHGSDVYRLRVIVVDLDEPGHAEACVKLNNFAAMGEWDITKLDAVLKTEGVDIAKTGFNVQDVYLMFGDTGAAMKMGDAAMDLAAAFGRSNERQTTLLSFTKRRDLGVYFYTTLFWPYGEDRQRAHDAFGWDQSPWQDGGAFHTAHLDFLATRGTLPGRHPEDILMAAAATIHKIMLPLRATENLPLGKGTVAVLIEHLEPTLAKLKGA